MDPAGPLFDHFAAALDLDQTDAMFVDVVHSNAKALQFGGAGLFRQIGDVDFYVNGGKSQPGCRDGVSAVLDLFQGSNGHDLFVCLFISVCLSVFATYKPSVYTKLPVKWF